MSCASAADGGSTSQQHRQIIQGYLREAMNGQDLVYDWRFNVVDEPTEWAFNWDYAECGTSKPTPREHHATMWMVMNDDDPVWGVKKYFKHAAKTFPIKLITTNPGSSMEDEDEDGGVYKFQIIHKISKAILFEGVMDKPDPESPDPNVGNYVLFNSKTKDGDAMMKNINYGNYGRIAYIPHVRTEINLGDGYKVVSTTGNKPDVSEDGNDHDGLATRFQLFCEEEEVARCHMTYRDGSWDPSMGPTIEMIAVKQSRRGEGQAKVLWYWVLRFIEQNFTIECLNNDAPVRSIMIKATQVSTQEVEMRQRKRDGALVPVGFKHLLHDFCSFSVREQKGIMGFMMGSRRPKDEEAVLYIPLLAPAVLAKKRKTDKNEAPKPGSGTMRSKCGSRMCHWCNDVGLDHMRCSKCEESFYCNPKCQKKDWKRHKKWCSKTREEVRARLIEEGGMTEDGALVMKPMF